MDAAPGVALRKVATYLWPQEKLSVEEISRRLLLEHLPWVESERNLIESVWIFPQGARNDL
jgi:hypothetical protein